MHTWMHAWMHAWIHARMHASMHAWVHAWMHAWMHAASEKLSTMSHQKTPRQEIHQTFGQEPRKKRLAQILTETPPEVHTQNFNENVNKASDGKSYANSDRKHDRTFKNKSNFNSATKRRLENSLET